MTERKYAKYFITDDKEALEVPAFRHGYEHAKRVTHIDADTVPGAEFYNESMWIVPGDTSPEGKVLADSHTHDWGQMVGFYGFEYEDINDLGAEIEFTIDGETHDITESFTAFIPAGVPHGPLVIKNVRKPIFHFSAGDTERYS